MDVANTLHSVIHCCARLKTKIIGSFWISNLMYIHRQTMPLAKR